MVLSLFAGSRAQPLVLLELKGDVHILHGGTGRPLAKIVQTGDEQDALLVFGDEQLNPIRAATRFPVPLSRTRRRRKPFSPFPLTLSVRGWLKVVRRQRATVCPSFQSAAHWRSWKCLKTNPVDGRFEGATDPTGDEGQGTRMVIRTANIDDAEQIARVHLASREAAYAGLLPRDALARDSLTSRTQKWRGILASAETTTVVAEEDGRIVGFANSGPTRTDGIDRRTTAEINTTYVLPECWRQGIGSALVTEAVRQLDADGFQEIILWCLDVNERARSFYGAIGFCTDGECREERMGDAVVRDVLCRMTLRREDVNSPAGILAK